MHKLDLDTLNNATWWRGCGRSDLQLCSGAVSKVGYIVQSVQLRADIDWRLRLLLDSYRHMGKAGGWRGGTLNRRTWTGSSSSVHNSGERNGGGDVWPRFD